MKFMNRLERKFGDFVVPHLTLILIAFQCFTFAMALVQPAFVEKLVLTHYALFSGDWWRVFTVLVIPPSTDPSYLIWILFFIYFFYLMGTALENQWGEFRYNLYILIGYLATVLTALIPGAMVTNSYLMQSVFLAFAWLFPEFEILLFFILPVKVKWIGLVVWIGYAVIFLMGGWVTKAEIGAGVLNFVIFFHGDIWERVRGYPRKYQNRMQQARAREEKPPMHVCAVCGVTDQSDRKMEFRYCPLCKGTPAYCINHINNHQHR